MELSEPDSARSVKEVRVLAATKYSDMLVILSMTVLMSMARPGKTQSIDDGIELV